MKTFVPPQVIPKTTPRPWLFLAGAIDQGRAEAWQNQVVEAFSDLPGTIANPRRPDWDASWGQTMADSRFANQVTWELEALDAADCILCWLPAGSQAPVSLLELGLHARGGRLIVGCGEGYHRQGNVVAVCTRYGIPLLHSLDALIAVARGHVHAPASTGGL